MQTVENLDNQGIHLHDFSSMVQYSSIVLNWFVGCFVHSFQQMCEQQKRISEIKIFKNTTRSNNLELKAIN